MTNTNNPADFYEDGSAIERKFMGGTVTLLFTDIEGSTELLKQLGQQYQLILSEHRRILREIVAKWNGREVDTQGDAFFFSFDRAAQAVSAAAEAQLSLFVYPWPAGSKLLVRMGVHTGEPWRAEEGYIGIDVHRAARIAHAGHGGQVLLSGTTTALVVDNLPPGVTLLDLGFHLLKDMPRPEHIHQLVITGLPSEFPPLRSQGLISPETVSAPDSIAFPDYLQSEKLLGEVKPVFVACDEELEKLDQRLGKAMVGQGGVMFITGSPGRGKTSLMNEFSWYTTARYQDLLIVKGACDAYSGEGDPYLPFRDILAMLSGDLETSWTARLINHVQARRLWKVLPEAVAIILDHGADLINRWIGARDLLRRVQQAGGIQPDYMGRLQVKSQQSGAAPGSSPVDQGAFFGQFTAVLNQLAKRHPLVLLLDDLQWIDHGSVQLLFYLCRRLAGNRILVVCAYRPEEVAQGRRGERHPLEELLAEVKRQWGDIWIDLDRKDARRDQQFVDAYLAKEPNRLSPDFRQALYEQTEGHPLFTVELLRYLQEQGDLAQDEEGRWIEKNIINWQAIPSRVEGVIEERIGRLSAELHDLLTIASVEGEEFTAQVLAWVRKLDEWELVRILSQVLDRQHRLIVDRGIDRVGKNVLGLFAFRHNLFQRYLYDHLNQLERVQLHNSVGEALESVYSGYTDKIAPQLARHFELAGNIEKAVQYYVLAGKYSVGVIAYQDAISDFNRALELLKVLPESPGRSQRELDLQLSLGPPLTAVKGWGAPELEYAYDRAQQLCEELTDERQMIRTFFLLATYWLGRSDHDRSEKIVDRLVAITEKLADPQYYWMGIMSMSPFYRGKFIQARERLERICRLYQPDQQRIIAQSMGMAPSIVAKAYLAKCLWILGYPQSAISSIEEAFSWADEVGIPFSRCYVLGRSCWLYAQLNDWEMLRTRAEELHKTATEHQFKVFENAAMIYLHYVHIQTDKSDDEEIGQMYRSIEAYSATGTIVNRTSWLVLYAEACAKLNRVAPGLKAADEAITLGEKTGELWVQADAYRLKGELFVLMKQEDENGGACTSAAEECFYQALKIAEDQDARSLALRAAMSLVRLTSKLGDSDRAYEILAEIYQSFDEGLDSPDLRLARKLYTCTS